MDLVDLMDQINWLKVLQRNHHLTKLQVMWLSRYIDPKFLRELGKDSLESATQELENVFNRLSFDGN